MLARKIMLFTIGIILLGSCVYLACLVIYNREYLHPTSIPRLISLMGIHLVILAYLCILIRVQLLEDLTRWGFYLTANITAFITISELYIFRYKKQYSMASVANFQQPSQIIYMNLYFLLYMFSLIVSFILGIIFITLRCVEWARQRRLEQSLEKNMRQIEFTQCLREQDCPICLSSFCSTDVICELPCHHKFHQSCLKEWIKLNYTCPNCRYNLVTQSNDEQVGQVF